MTLLMCNISLVVIDHFLAIKFWCLNAIPLFLPSRTQQALKKGTLNLADIEDWKLAETESWKFADTMFMWGWNFADTFFRREGNLPKKLLTENITK